jgi:Tfp pilus assembly protein PilN
VEQKAFKRPAHTLLYITGNKICRLDSDRKGQILGKLEILDIPCETSSALPNAIEKLTLQIGQPLGRKCWILYSQLHSYELSLPSAQIAGVDNNVVIDALKFEYESITGEVLKNSQLSYQLLYTSDEMSHFWTHVIASDTLTKIIERLRKAKSNLAGLTHAGGLPHLLSNGEPASWLKLEYWPNSVFALSQTPEQGLNLQVFHPQQNSHWQEELKHWLLEQRGIEQSEALTTNMQLEKNTYVDTTYTLIPEGSLLMWLELWLQHLVSKEAVGIPLLLQQADSNEELLYMVGSGLAALVLCGSHAGWMLYQTHSYQNETTELNKVKQQIDGMRSSLKTSKEQLEKLEKDQKQLTKNSKSIPKALVALKQRPVALLKILSQYTPEDVVIEDIKQNEQHLVITGVALRSELSNQLASMIEQPLAALGWKVKEPNSHSLDIFGKDNGPWEFELTIEDLGLKGFLNTSKT